MNKKSKTIKCPNCGHEIGPEGLRMESPFEWLPPDKREWRLGPPLLPDVPETRIPAFYIETQELDEWTIGIFFVNNTDEVIDSVTAGSGGFQTLDDDVINVGGPEYSYESVKSNEAVLIEKYDRLYDSDFLLGVTIEVKSSRLGSKQFSISAKGGYSREVLLWNNGDVGNGRW